MKQPWNASRIWSHLGYSGQKAVVFLPIEISLGVVLNTVNIPITHIFGTCHIRLW